MNRFTIFAALLAFIPSLPALAQDKTKPKEPKSLAEIKSKAEAGDAKAQWSLGQIYEYGRFEYGQGVEPDNREAINWYRKAAEQNYPPAQADLGEMYRDGKGLENDHKQAIKWFTKSSIFFFYYYRISILRLRNFNFFLRFFRTS